MTQNLNNITAIDWNIREYKTPKGEVKKMINVYFEINDFIYLKGTLLPKKDNGYFVKIATSSYKKDDVWKDMRHAGICNREASDKIQQTLIDAYVKAKGKPELYVSPNSTYEARKKSNSKPVGDDGIPF